MKAFIGRTFDENDDALVTRIAEFIESAGIESVNAKKASSEPVNEKVRERILECEIFVGVFTRAEEISNNNRLIQLRPRKKNRRYTTSNWVIQESGFAIGYNKHLILLVEKGVDKLPKLQGDMEYIPFERDSINDTLTSLNQMITSIKAKITGGVVERATEEAKSLDTIESEEIIEEKEKEPKDKKNELFKKIHFLLLTENNYSEAQRIFDEELEVELDADEKISWRGFILRESQKLGDKEALSKLKKLEKDNIQNPEAIGQMALQLKEIGEYQKAKEKFLLANSKYNTDDPKQMESLLYFYGQAAECLISDNSYDKAIELLREQLFNTQLKQHKKEVSVHHI